MRFDGLRNKSKVFHNLEVVCIIPYDGFVFWVTLFLDATKIESLTSLNVGNTTGTKMTLANLLQLNLQRLQILVLADCIHLLGERFKNYFWAPTGSQGVTMCVHL